MGFFVFIFIFIFYFVVGLLVCCLLFCGLFVVLIRQEGYVLINVYMGQVVQKCTIGAGQAKIIKLTITLNNFITLEDQLIPFI